MVMSCAAFNCKNRFQNNCGLSFHRFPKDPELRKQWAIATKRKNFVPTDVSALCSKHFLESDYEIGGLIRKLKPFVVPSIFEFPANLHLETNAPKRRRVLFRHEIPGKHSKNKNENAEIELKNKNSITSSLPNEEECMMLSSHGSPTKTSTLKKETRFHLLQRFYSDVKALTTRLIEEEKFQYFLTYKLSQDHLELFFSCIRSMGGHNNNPNVLQFKWALRKLMFKNSVRCSDGSNCIEFDPHVQASILSSTVAQNTATTKVETENYYSTIFSQNFFENDTVSYYQQNVLYHIAGYIASKLTSKVECETCCQLLVNTTNSKLMFCSDFLNNVNMGKLFYPSNDLFKVVCYFHKMLKLYTDQMNTFNMNKCIVVAMNHFGGTVFREHSELVEIAEETHELKLIKMIGYLYFKIKCHDLAKKNTQILNTGSKGLRQTLNKIILFNHT